MLAIVGVVMQVFVFRRLEGDDLRQTLVSIGISIVAADLMLAVWAGGTYQIATPEWLDGALTLPVITAVRSNGASVFLTYPLYRVVVLAAAIVPGAGGAVGAGAGAAGVPAPAPPWAGGLPAASPPPLLPLPPLPLPPSDGAGGGGGSAPITPALALLRFGDWMDSAASPVWRMVPPRLSMS